MINENEKEFEIVNAYKIDNVHIYYKCKHCYKLKSGRIIDSPFCKKTNRIYSSAKPMTHIHGSGGNLEARIEQRKSHCSINHNKEIKIIIDENTQGCLKKKIKTLKGCNIEIKN